MVTVYPTKSSLRGGSIYKRVEVTAVRLLFYTQYFIFYILTITFYQEQQYM